MKSNVEYYLTGLPIAAVVVVSFVIGILNYSGFCFHQGRFQSEEERLKIVVGGIVAQDWAELEYVNSLDVNDERRLQIERNRPGETIPYKDMDEFFALNPNCCQVTTNYRSIGGEGDNTSFWGRLTGSKASVVGVRYLLRYRDEKGVIKTDFIEIFPGISNCGELVWDLG